MALIVGLVLIGIAGLFLWQNLQIVTLVFFGGIMTVQLPIAVWVLAFIFLGVFSNLTLQFLFGFGRPAPRSSRTPTPTPPPAGPVDLNRTPPSYSVPKNDWERGGGEDWDIDAPPVEPTYIKNPAPTEPENGPVNGLEIDQSPDTTIQTGTVYSYSYRESKKSDKSGSDPVYDADYRIITPPPVNTPSPEPKNDDDDEEWV
ncbi:MAG: hypothetical protein N5P05_001508 [Chroococcopsis gigantea SAG 12.99]|jgi:hypothetical protein|nr:LapA family protein [Chlorogloea purpurea SAG 13.99]MDV2999902.1 hypothetical protein [Chroococcopsis gigantea SAG 12.99]